MYVYLVYEYNNNTDYHFFEEIYTDRALAEKIATRYNMISSHYTYKVVPLEIKGDVSMTAFETIGNVKLNELADDELTSIINNLMQEQKNREKAKQEEAWNKLVDMMKNYIYHYGNITIDSGNDYTIIDETSEFSDPGIIE